MRRTVLMPLTILCVCCAAGENTGEAFFESKIRPLLIEKCIGCHGEQKQKGALRLDSRAGWQKGGERGPAIVLGKPDESLLIKAVSYGDTDLKMPPKKNGGPLSKQEVAALTEWVKMGAPDPRGTETRAGGAILEKAKAWRAFQPVRKPKIPGGGDAIDAFLTEKMTAAGLKPAGAADKRTLIRRATFDLIGLPPSPSDVAKFLTDDSPEAFARVVDRLLDSPAYGQRWARHWLDVARYADYHDAEPKSRTASCEPSEAWRYRDWVVDSFNKDFPFDQFITYQIAGDLLPTDPNEAGRDARATAGMIATGFLVNGCWDRGDADKEKLVSDMVDDQIDTVGKAFMGLTLGCARCHDHKFDPVSNEDYYALAGIFYSTHIMETVGTKGGEITLKRVPLVPRDVAARRDAMVLQFEAVKAKLAALEKLTPKLAADHPERVALTKERDALQAELPPPYAQALTAQEGGMPGGLFPNIQDVPLHIRGSYTRLGAVVPRRMPSFFAGEAQPKIAQGSGRRELAAWVASKDNPLTARVIVNRVWQWHFGAGLVQTPNNFGLLSEPPSHPELHDWLAAQFVEDGWSLKKLQRRIMLTAAYQRTGSSSAAEAARDPENRWLARFSARRLEAEAIRDAMIFATGRLDQQLGGAAGADLGTTRRSLYVQTARWDRGNYAMLFDAANPDTSVEKRTASTVAPQALLLLNHEFIRTLSGELAKRIIREAPAGENERVEWVYQLLFARSAKPEEIAIAHELLAKSAMPDSEDAWRTLAHVLLCCNEFVYVE